jgi:phosphoribosylaminoimidazolecarboxamide formyltransferase/IMP cyclohydrolase
MGNYITLKYGLNPHQGLASVQSTKRNLPFIELNGQPGYINLLDAINAWQLVKELYGALGFPAATSFKHVSPAGAAVGETITDAYRRARNADPKSSFGDFIALSHKVDLECAEYIKTVVSDGIAAPAYDEDALKLLKEKKGGKYIILLMDPNYQPPPIETREIFGVGFSQQRNDIKLNQDTLLTNIVTENKIVPAEAQNDLILASITLKYTQSNSIGYALNGQMIGIGAGQQSRIDCTELAGQKATTWAKERWRGKQNLSKASLASDAFFPFRDNIDYAAKCGVKYIIQAGGSIKDEEVINAANEHDMVMYFTGIRLFHH